MESAARMAGRAVLLSLVAAMVQRGDCYLAGAPSLRTAGLRVGAISAGRANVLGRQGRRLGFRMQVENFGDSPNDVLKWTKERDTVKQQESPKMQGKAMGEWDTPITSRSVTVEAIELSDVRWDGGDVYWLEYRPTEGRTVIMRRSDDGVERTVTPNGKLWDVGSSGEGSPYTVSSGVVYFSNKVDGALYTQFAAFEVEPVPLTPSGDTGYSHLDLDAARERLVCVCNTKGASTLVAVSLADQGEEAPGAPAVLLNGGSVLAAPRISPDLRRMAWVEVSEGTSKVFSAKVSDEGLLEDPAVVAQSAAHPMWSGMGVLHYASEAAGRWNVMEEGSSEPLLSNLEDDEEVFGGSGMGPSPVSFLPDGTLLCLTVKGGGAAQSLVSVDPLTREATLVGGKKSRVVSAESLSVSEDGNVGLVGSLKGAPSAVSAMAVGTEEWVEVRSSVEVKPRVIYTSETRSVEFVGLGKLPGRLLLYPPRNDRFQVALGDTPPLVLWIGEGSCSVARHEAWYWTSRGFAFAAMPGALGREERAALAAATPEEMAKHATAGAQHLAKEGLVNREKMCVFGAGGGGAVAAHALVQGMPFAAGACLWGEMESSVPVVAKPIAVLHGAADSKETLEAARKVHAQVKESQELCVKVEVPGASQGAFRRGKDRTLMLDTLLLFVSRALKLATVVPADLDDELVRLDNFDPLLPGEPRSYIVIDGWELEVGRTSEEIREVGYEPVDPAAYFPEERPDRPTGTDMDQEEEETPALQQIEWL